MPESHDEVYKVLADGHRRRIVAALGQGPRRAGELAALVGLAPNALSFHLRRLLAARLVAVHRDGRYLYYQLDAGTLQDWLGQVGRIFRSTGPGRPTLPTGPGRSQPGRRRSPVAGRKGRTRRPGPAVSPAPPSPAPTQANWLTEPLPTELL